MATAIKVENVSKAYQLGVIGTGTLSNDLKRWYARSTGKEDPFLKIGEVNDRTVKGTSDVVWSLKDINFEIEEGDAVGIIGRNGAGKSTLLKILSRVTSPTTGKITGNGRVASLLEVGTGFHPELTGKDNIYLNGAILGMRKKEIKKKFDAIVNFAGVERYIDTPVKRYSSGMYVRLAFAVAAYLESEILIVDEVLAVGDAEFQKKCLGKMNEVSKGEGKTILFVSHNMGAVKKLCKKGLLLINGTTNFNGDINNCIQKYLDQNTIFSSATYDLNFSDSAEITKISIVNNKGLPASEISIGTQWEILIEFVVHKSVNNLVVAIGLSDVFGHGLKTTWQKSKAFEPGKYLTTFIENKTNFALGKYYVHASLSKGKESIKFIENAISFYILDGKNTIGDQLVSIDSATGIIVDQMHSDTIKI